MPLIIRIAKAEDSEQLWCLMKELAVFEKYIESFAITPSIVRECGFEKTPPDFYCIVAEDQGLIVGMLVYYFIPYTAQNKSAIYMKELYVEVNSRGKNIGKKLMNALKEEAIRFNCTQIKWTVAPWNIDGQRFYERLGAKVNMEWINYEMNM
jgi:ribosomal protein S18 acetylase RimI-like enzyme